MQVKDTDVDLWAGSCSTEQASMLYTYYAVHNIQKGNMRCAEVALAKAFLCCSHGRRGIILALWSAINLTRGHIPSTQALREHNVVEFHGIVLAVQSGRLDVFDNAVACHKASFASLGLLFPVLKIRMVVARNFVIRFFKEYPSPESQVNLEQLFDYATECGMTNVFSSVEEMRDHHLIPLVLHNYISGYIHMDHNILKMSERNPFPENDVEGEVAAQPPEPVEAEIA